MLILMHKNTDDKNNHFLLLKRMWAFFFFYSFNPLKYKNIRIEQRKLKKSTRKKSLSSAFYHFLMDCVVTDLRPKRFL